MNIAQHRSYFICAIVLIAFYGVSAQICPTDGPSTNDSFYNNEGFLFPQYSNPFNVSDNQQHRWLLEFNDGDLYAILVLLEQENRYAGLTSTLYDTYTHTSYPFTTSGTFPTLGLRSSPDFKWATLYDFFLSGGGYDGSPKFNVSISYADFWSDSPANDIYYSKELQYLDNTDCSRTYVRRGGNNFVQSKGFWIAFDFDDGRHLYFNVPAGPSASLYRNTYLSFDENCN